MDSSDRGISRRTILRSITTSAVLAITGVAKAQQVSESLKPPADVSASSLSRDENYWNNVRVILM